MTQLPTGINRKLKGKYTFKRGIHPPHRKMSQASPVERVVIPAGHTVLIPMSQHIGAPCEPIVAAKDEVTAGQVIGQANAFVSAPVHSSINGVVKQVAPLMHPSGRKVLTVEITATEQQPEPNNWKNCPDIDLEKYEPDAICSVIRDAGLVGMGGAAFPTVVKLTQNEKKPVDTIILNGCECEPYLTSDHRLMLEAPGPIIAGLQLAMKAAGAKNGIIAIEDNKPDAINGILEAIENVPNVSLAICKTKYPQGGEKQLIKAVLKRDVPNGGLPLDVGVVVVNVGTASAIAWACIEGRPFTERIVTVTGKGITRQGNFLVPIGLRVSELLKHCGGLTDDAAKVLLGGPMMGPTTATLDVPILKGTSGITVMSESEVSKQEATACIRCSRCVDFCPMNLVPTRIAHASKARNVEMALDYDLMACMECGSCAYVCPAQIPLTQYLRSGKAQARNKK
ncbi:MAG: electron transport complex subunit RsxC [Phycisphaerae bacterium]|nr:electron transport complex subunit RsxC [Phycisphaerae bacterium]